MSLINDALKRAKQAQQQAQSPPGNVLQFRPVEPSQRTQRRYDWVVPVVVAAVGTLAFIFIWSWARKDTASKSAEPAPQAVVAAKEISAPTAGATSLPAPAPPSPIVAAPAPAPNSAPAATEATGATSAPPSSEPPAPKPPPLRLQAIVFSPTRPSAMINGRTLWVGDKLGALRVVAIDHESATLVGLGQTNVLMLDQ
jgi:hypothetical protein